MFIFIENNYYYHYRKNKKSDYWQCKVKGCSASATISHDNEIIRQTEHNGHKPDDPMKLEMLKSIEKIKCRIKQETKKSVKAIYDEVVKKFVQAYGKEQSAIYLTEFEK